MINKILNNTKGDRWIWLIVILLSVISLLAVYSAIGSLAYKRHVGYGVYFNEACSHDGGRFSR